jgi:hypothetical protein
MTASSKVLDDIQAGIYNRYKYIVNENDKIAAKENVLADIKSQLHKLFDDSENQAIIGLCDLLDKESAGLIKREAGISYLEYLLNYAKQQKKDSRALEKIVNNIRLVENYIYDPNRDNKDYQYQVTQRHACDLRELLGNANAFSDLPVIGLINGNLEERTSEEERVFVFGIRFKANNPVPKPDDDFPDILIANQSVYARHLGKAIEVLKLAKQYNTDTGGENTNYRKLDYLIGKAIKTVFLWYMVFSKAEQDDKKQEWQAIATKLHARDNDALDQLLALADNMLKAEKVVIETTIKPAISVLKAILAGKKTTGTLTELDKQRFLVLDKQLVNDDPNEAVDGNILKELKNATQKKRLKPCLRYVRIVKKQKDIPVDALYSTDFPVYLSFHDTFFYADKANRREIEVNAQIQPWNFLPVLVEPEYQPTDKVAPQYHVLLQSAGLKVRIGHCLQKKESDKANVAIFLCKIITAIVFQLALSALAEKLKTQCNHLAIPIVRVHGGEEDNNETYFKSVCASVAFLLNEKYTAGMQGIRLINLDSVKNERQRQNLQKYIQHRITNARSSLYAFLPKTFSVPGFAPAFNKLAIVIVSSRVASKHRYQEDDYRLVNIFGRVVMLERVSEHVKVNTHFLTFADNDYQREICQGHLKKLVDTVHYLYDKHEVRDILYIAKFPFTSHLNLTRKEAQHELFFMSETVLQAMRQNRTDLNIYPTFCEQYPAKKLDNTQLHTIYIDNVSSLQKHVQMDSGGHSQLVTFLNIANGISVESKDENENKNFFNNLMSYTTLGNIYTDHTLQSRIMERLIASDDAAPRKTLIDFICLLHAAAYEKFEKKELFQLTLKLNPYQDILEQDNVNKLSTFPAFSNGKPEFNLFAFMTKIQRIISRFDKPLA